jgi:hypothetical protein
MLTRTAQNTAGFLAEVARRLIHVAWLLFFALVLDYERDTQKFTRALRV